MALFQDLGSWLRSVRRDNFNDSPILAVEKLNSVPQPLQDADKEILVGAVLTMSSSLHVALGILRELLPQEASRERLGEVLCPTLGHLLVSLQSTLTAFEQAGSAPVTRAPSTPLTHTPQPTTSHLLDSSTRRLSPQQIQPAQGLGEEQPTPELHAGRLSGSPRFATVAQLQDGTKTEDFPPLEDTGAPRCLHVEANVHCRPEIHLTQALQAEMRVQAAIHVAVESLEFAEGQLKLVKEVNKLHGGGK
jgi:hypothetical protein